jgi:hypothetical protein
MRPLTYSTPVLASSETVWALLLDEMTNPKRYDDNVSKVQIEKQSKTDVARTLKRQGKMWREELEAITDALMVEHLCRSGESIEVTLIHQVVPMGATSLLNFAATMPALDKAAENSQDLTPDLMARANTFKEIAESL